MLVDIVGRRVLMETCVVVIKGFLCSGWWLGRQSNGGRWRHIILTIWGSMPGLLAWGSSNGVGCLLPDCCGA
jgi:hypothetical protein